mgnify:CR=1 FL=1
MQVFVVPSGFNSLATFLAAREPLYRQNVFQFFSALNPAYNTFVKANGHVVDEKSCNADTNHLKQLYAKVLQVYLREAKRALDVKVFKAKIWRQGQDEPSVHYFSNRVEVGSLQQQE